MNKRFLSVTVLLVLALSSVTCQTTNRTQDGQQKAQGPTPETPLKGEMLKWPPLSPVVRSTYVVNTAQLARVGAGDALALPLASGFQR